MTQPPQQPPPWESCFRGTWPPPPPELAAAALSFPPTGFADDSCSSVKKREGQELWEEVEPG